MEKVSPYKVFSAPEYWCGEVGSYRPGPDGLGYRDFPINQTRAEYLVSKRPGKLLDLGCGWGFLVKRLRGYGVDAWGMDISSVAMERAPKEVRPYLKRGNIARIPFPDKFFEFSCSFGVLEHLTYQDALSCCKEISRVSNRGIHAIGISTELSAMLPPELLDKTHRTMFDYYWWRDKLPVEFEVWEGSDETWWPANNFRAMVIAPSAYPVGGYGYGGIERLAFLLSRGLAGKGLRATLAAPHGSVVPRGVEFLDTGAADSGDFVNQESKAFAILNPVVGGYSVILDLSHSHWSGRLLPYHTRTVNPIWHAPDLMQPPEPQWNVIALSQWQADGYSAFHKAKGRAKVLDIHILDRGRESGREPDRESICGDRFLCIGKVNQRKGTLEAVEMCRDMGVGLDIVGPLGEDTGYNNRVMGYCKGKVDYLGELPHKSVLELASRARALLYPLQESEAHSHKGVDVLGEGCPIVIYDRGAQHEFIQHGVDGFLARDRKEFMDYMGIVDKLDRNRIRQRAWARWNPEVVMGKLIPLLIDTSRGARW